MVTCARRFDRSLGLKGQCAGYKRLYGIKIRYAGSCKEAEKIACTFIGSVFTCKTVSTGSAKQQDENHLGVYLNWRKSFFLLRCLLLIGFALLRCRQVHRTLGFIVRSRRPCNTPRTQRPGHNSQTSSGWETRQRR